ncbi:hypothetical protein NKG94_27575 [Micromonospora sp. M12]
MAIPVLALAHLALAARRARQGLLRPFFAAWDAVCWKDPQPVGSGRASDSASHP